MQTSQERPLTASEASTFLNISLSTLYKWTHRKQIPHYKPSGKLLYFSLSELQEYISSKRVQTSEEISREADQYIHRAGGKI